MFERLANLFRRDAEPQNEQAPKARPIASEAPDAPEARQTATGTKDALQRFMRLVTAHLVAVEGRRLTNAVLTGFDSYGDAAEAFEEGILGDEGQQRGQWLVIQVDWEAHEELEWQVAEVATSFGIQGQWRWASSESETRTVPAGLCDAANWVASLGYELLHLDLGGDAYFALMVRGDGAENAYRAAVAAGLDVLRTTEFARANAS